MTGICQRCYTSGIKVTIVDGKTLCKNCEQNYNEERLG